MRSSTIALCALMLAAPAGAALAQTPPPGQDQGHHGFLSPELRYMMRGDQGDRHSMTPEQRQAMREQMRSQWQSMSPAQKEQMRAQLQAKWDALSPAEKQAIEQKIAERRAHWQQNGAGQNGSGQ
jgi:Spy/CpxP family protein refolding chaperone